MASSCGGLVYESKTEYCDENNIRSCSNLCNNPNGFGIIIDDNSSSCLCNRLCLDYFSLNKIKCRTWDELNSVTAKLGTTISHQEEGDTFQFNWLHIVLIVLLVLVLVLVVAAAVVGYLLWKKYKARRGRPSDDPEIRSTPSDEPGVEMTTLAATPVADVSGDAAPLSGLETPPETVSGHRTAPPSTRSGASEEDESQPLVNRAASRSGGVRLPSFVEHLSEQLDPHPSFPSSRDPLLASRTPVSSVTAQIGARDTPEGATLPSMFLFESSDGGSIPHTESHVSDTDRNLAGNGNSLPAVDADGATITTGNVRVAVEGPVGEEEGAGVGECDLLLLACEQYKDE